ncbi:MAG: DUF4388 domain-containing protein [Proteobacteria bacterium]|nr:DUF4388 domain-containing protein [Pseudomonadota bacterium]
MKLLAVVEDNLRNILIRHLGCEIEFYPSWKLVDSSRINGFGYVIAMGKCIENAASPIDFWGVASEIRYFGISAVFIDLSIEASCVLPRVYPEFKSVSYNGDSEKLIAQLSKLLPIVSESDSRKDRSGAGERKRTEQTAVNNFSVSDDLSGSRMGRSEPPRTKRNASGSGFDISSITLSSRSSSDRLAVGDMNERSSFRNRGRGAGRPIPEASLSNFELAGNDSGFGLDSRDMSAINEALNRSSDNAVIEPAERSGNRSHASQLSKLNEASHVSSNSITVNRSTKDVMLGKIEFGLLVRIIQTLLRINQTGILEVQNESRIVKLEFRQGKVYSTHPLGLVQGIFSWTSGKYNFNSGQMLSGNAQQLDIEKLFNTAIRDQLPLNAILRALEGEFNNYISLTSYFVQSSHILPIEEQWWKKCDGSIKLSQIMMTCGVDMEVVSRDIYLAWLCDEIFFTPDPNTRLVKIEYESIKIRASNHDSSHPSLNDIAPSAEDSHLNMIRAELQRVRASFDTEDGYTILGVKIGCGTKALDDAYYAWVNKYHTDRFVRFKDPSFIQMANEILMLMNSTYAKLSKVERQGFGNARAIGAQQQRNHQPDANMADVSTRLGPGRARSNTMLSQTESGQSDLIGEIRGMENKKRETVRPRSTIRPPSVSQAPIPPENLKKRTPSQVLRMSDLLAERNAGDDKDKDKAGDSSVSTDPVVRSKPWASSSATPEQLFQTAKKKLTLGLGQEALMALDWALEAQPDNIDFNNYRAYAAFLVDPSNVTECVQTLTDGLAKLREEYSGTTYPRESYERFFAPFYFLGKIYIATNDYTKANEALLKAAKFDPSDVDVQRSLRYVAMQLEKQQAEQQQPAKKSGILDMIRSGFNKKL